MARDNGKDDTQADNKGADDDLIKRPKPGMKNFYGYPITFWVNSVLGKPLLLIGLVLAIMGRGCDATGMRSVSRTDAAYRQETLKLELEWDGKIAPKNLQILKKQREITELQQSLKPDAKPEDFKSVQEKTDALRKEIDPLQKELSKMNGDRSIARAEAETGAWKTYREASLRASNSNRWWSYYYEIAFIFGTILLVLGLLIVAFTGEGAERWIAYIMMAIITFSVYVGGAAWIESIITSAKSGDVNPPAVRQQPIDFDDPRFDPRFPNKKF